MNTNFDNNTIDNNQGNLGPIFLILFLPIIVVILSLGGNSNSQVIKTVNEKRLLSKERIVSLHYDEDINVSINGGIFVTRRYINEICYYRIMKKDGKKYLMDQVLCDKTYILEKNGVNPQLQKWYSGNIRINKLNNKEEFDLWNTNLIRYEIIVPKGSIVKEFIIK